MKPAPPVTHARFNRGPWGRLAWLLAVVAGGTPDRTTQKMLTGLGSRARIREGTLERCGPQRMKPALRASS